VATANRERPPENPYPGGIEPRPEPVTALVRPVPDTTRVIQLEAELQRLRELEAKHEPAEQWSVPSTLSVTAFLTFVQDPDEFFRRYVRRVPAPPSPAANLGTEVHRRIELHARGVAALGGLPEDLVEPYDLDLGERTGDLQRSITAPSLLAQTSWRES
jgi:hypothetical protein